MRQFLELLWGMTEKELRVRYKNTVFGFLWMFINPVLQMLVIGFIFRFFMKEPIENYYYYLFIGLLVWNFFSLSLTKSTSSIIGERNLIKKASFPHSVIPLAIILSNFIHLLIAMTLLILPMLFIKALVFSEFIYVFIGFLFLLIFTVGISLLTSALNVRFRDINFFVQALLIVWFYATPVIYPLSMIPYQFYWLWWINPMTSTLQFFQHGFLRKPLPGIGMISVNFLLIVLVFIIGIKVFDKESKNFDDWV